MMRLQEAVIQSSYALVPTTFRTSTEFVARYGPSKTKKGPYIVIDHQQYTPAMTVSLVDDETIKIRVMSGNNKGLVAFKEEVLPMITPEQFTGKNTEWVFNHEARLIGAKSGSQTITYEQFENILCKTKVPVATMVHCLDWESFTTDLALAVIKCSVESEYDKKRVAFYIPGEEAAHVNELPLAGILISSLPLSAILELESVVEKDVDFVEPVLYHALMAFKFEVFKALVGSEMVTSEFLGRIVEAVKACS